jgi:hypothetical protein
MAETDNKRAYWGKYVAGNAADRSAIIAELASAALTTTELYSLLYSFKADRPAYLVLFKPYIQHVLADERARMLDIILNSKDDSTEEDKQKRYEFSKEFFVDDNVLRNNCCEVRKEGVNWDMDKLAIVDAILQEEYAGRESLLTVAEQQTQDYHNVIRNTLNEITRHSAVASISAPVYYGYNDDTDEPTTSSEFPKETLDKIAFDYNELMNCSFGDFSLDGLPANVVMRFTEDKQHAIFDFFIIGKEVNQLSETAIESLRDGKFHYFSDLNYFTKLVGHKELTPSIAMYESNLILHTTDTPQSSGSDKKNKPR